MKTTTIASLYLILLLVFFGALFLSPMATTVTILATVDIEPDKINLFDSADKGNGPYVSAFIKFPKPHKKSLLDINISTVFLDGVVPASKGELTSRATEGGGQWYKAYFDRYAVEVHLWTKIYHIGLTPPFKNKPVELTVTGKLYNGTPFEGSDTILVSTK